MGEGQNQSKVYQQLMVVRMFLRNALTKIPPKLRLGHRKQYLIPLKALRNLFGRTRRGHGSADCSFLPRPRAVVAFCLHVHRERVEQSLSFMFIAEGLSSPFRSLSVKSIFKKARISNPV